MGKTICPGQDTRYWHPGDIFEVRCGTCGYEVEFFRDDAQRRCPKCGSRVQNPKLNLGCAQWCEHAKECLGYDPKERQAESGQIQESMADQIIGLLRRRMAKDKAGFETALAVLEEAQRLVRDEGGDPKLVIAAALLAGLETAEAETVMKEAGLDSAAREDIGLLINQLKESADFDSIEAKILSDAVNLVKWKALKDNAKEPGARSLQDRLLTRSGRNHLTRILETAGDSLT